MQSSCDYNVMIYTVSSIKKIMSQNDKLNEAIYLQFTQQKKISTFLSGPIIQKKAKLMFAKSSEKDNI